MNVKRYVIGSLAVWVMIFLFEFVFHGMLLKGMYEGVRHLLRPEESFVRFFFWVVLGELMLAFGFCYIFIKGYEGRGVAEGVRFGLYAGIAFMASTMIINYAVQPWPGSLTAAWIIGYLIELMLAGVVIAAIYKPATTS
ncbi:MAG TPA: hypothetical protein VGB22_09960 [candidate division Zixibacteria bacterium]|jgi:hypothetical protein